ncbi:MAG TPA: DUF805 domain-containing protein [Nevskiaceae bacterium]|nr:DUF805 domain-containing protein [Nevskiaceae bacterium]
MNWYLEVLQKKYAQFDGRAHREEFWMFVLVNFLASLAVGIVAWIIHLQLLRALYALAVLVPSLALGARRLHDTHRSGWWQLIVLIPVIGWIVLLVFFVQPGDAGDNSYGADPRGAAPAAAS